MLTTEAIDSFRSKYRELFGAVRKEDALYESISEGRKYAGMEHWLPLYYDRLETLFDYVPEATITLDNQAEQSRDMRLQQVEDLYQARVTMWKAEQKDKIPRSIVLCLLHRFTCRRSNGKKKISGYEAIDLSPFSPTPGQKDAGGKKGRDFGDIRAQTTIDLYATIREHIEALNRAGKKVLVCAYSAGSRDRLKHLLEEQGLYISPKYDLAVLGLEHGFETADLAVLTEQDLLGDRLSRTTKKRKKSDAFLFEISQLHEGDFVVHEDHGVGQFDKLETVVVDGVPHDCLKLIYAGGDKLFVPVENLDVLSRYGSAEAGAVLDKLGGAAWQARKARVKRDLLALAQELLKIAAARILRHSDPIQLSPETYEKFSAGFPTLKPKTSKKPLRMLWVISIKIRRWTG